MKGIRAEENQCDDYEKITIIKSNVIFSLKAKQHALIYEDFKWDFFSPSLYVGLSFSCLYQMLIYTNNERGKACGVCLLERLPIKFFKLLT